MDKNNTDKFMTKSGKHISSMNRALKYIKSNMIVDFICFDHYSLIITTNQVTSQLDISTIENYIKINNALDKNDIQMAWLLQLKLYLKILDIPYIIKGSSSLLNSSVTESIIKSTYIFNNICLVSKLHVINISPKLDMVIIWVNI